MRCPATTATSVSGEENRRSETETEEMQPATEEIGLSDDDGWAFDLTELHPPLLINFELLRQQSRRPATESAQQQPQQPPEQPQRKESSSSISNNNNGIEPSQLSFENVYYQPSPATPSSSSVSTHLDLPPLIAKTPNIVQGSSSDDSDSEYNQRILMSYRRALSLNRGPLNTIHPSSGRVYRKPRVRKVVGRRREEGGSEAVETNTRNKRTTRKKRLRRKEDLAVATEAAPLATLEEMENDETIDVGCTMDWKNDPELNQQQPKA